MLHRKKSTFGLHGGELGTQLILPYQVVPTYSSSRRTLQNSMRLQHQICKPWVLAAIVAFMMTLVGYIGLEAITNDHQSPSGAESNIPSADSRPLQDSFETLFENLQAENSHMRSDMRALRTTISDLQHEKIKLKKVDHTVEVEWQINNAKLQDQNHGLQQAIQDMSRRQLQQNFGAGPYHVQVELELQATKTQEEGSGAPDVVHFVIELADQEMPHSVDWFLDKVKKQMYDGMRFYDNSQRIAMGGTSEDVASLFESSELRHRFETDLFSQLVFSEYSETFPHLPYTIGMVSRTGGASFYVNTVHNSKRHGPDIQGFAGAADPCFARVVEGFQAVDRMHKSTGDGYSAQMMQDIVIIRSMRLLAHYTVP